LWRCDIRSSHHSCCVRQSRDSLAVDSNLRKIVHWGGTLGPAMNHRFELREGCQQWRLGANSEFRRCCGPGDTYKSYQHSSGKNHHDTASSSLGAAAFASVAEIQHTLLQAGSTFWVYRQRTDSAYSQHTANVQPADSQPTASLQPAYSAANITNCSKLSHGTSR